MELSVDEDLAYAVEVIKDAISETKGVLKDPLPSVCIRALSDRRVTLELVWWTVSKPAEMDRVRDSVIFAIRCSLRDAEIALPSSGEQFFMDCIRTYDQQDRPAERQLGIREESEPGIVKDPFAL